MGCSTVLANALQLSLFAEAPKKNRQQENSQLSTDAGVLVTSSDFEATEIERNAEQEAKKASKTLKR